MKTHAMLAVASLTVAGGCAMGIAAGADYSPDVDFTTYSSYTFDDPDDRPVGDPRLENNTLFESRVHAAIALELAVRGVTREAERPDLVVHHHVSVRDRIEVYEADREAGYGIPEWGDGTQVMQYEEGIFIVDVADAETRDLLWRGWARFDIGRAMTDPRTMAGSIDEAIAGMFERYPVESR